MPCHFCARSVNEEDFCYGCQTYVCDDCDEEVPLGPHQAADHKESDYDT